MNRGFIRIISILMGAAVLFGLQTQLGLPIYIAVPGAILAYIASLYCLGLVVTSMQSK
jgi:uncharacterized membrane protein